MSDPITMMNNDIRSLFDHSIEKPVRVWGKIYDFKLTLSRSKNCLHAALTGAPQFWKMRGGKADMELTSTMYLPNQLVPRINEMYCVLIHLRHILVDMQLFVKNPESITCSLSVKGTDGPIAIISYDNPLLIREVNPDYSIGKIISLIGGGKIDADTIPGSKCTVGALGLTWLTNFNAIEEVKFRRPKLCLSYESLEDYLESPSQWRPVESELVVSGRYQKYFLVYDRSAYFRKE